MMSDAEDVCELLERDHDNAVRTFAAAFQQAVDLKPKKQGDKADANDQTGEHVLEHCNLFWAGAATAQKVQKPFLAIANYFQRASKGLAKLKMHFATRVANLC
jgi:hypothetical protein